MNDDFRTFDKPSATLRPSYRFLTYIQQSRGVKVNPNLLGDDRPDELNAFTKASNDG